MLGFEEVWAKTDIDMAAVTGIPGLREKTLVQLLVPGGSRIELQEFDPPGRIAERPITDSGLNHLSFGVEDIYAEYERLKAAGVKFNSEVLDLDFGPGEILTGVVGRLLRGSVGDDARAAGTDPWIRRRRRRRRTATRVGRGQLAFVDNDGIRIYCEVVGTGPAVLFTHGFGATSEMFAPQRNALAATHTVVTWDMRGHGRSDYPADQDAYSPARVLGDMRALLDGHDIERAVIVGHSVGGYLSLRFRLFHPDRVNGLVLIGTAPGFRRDDRRDEWNRYCKRRGAELDERGLDVEPQLEVLAAKHRDAKGLAHAARGFLRSKTRR